MMGTRRRGAVAAAWVAVWALALLSGAAQGAGSPEKDRDILVRFRDSLTNWEAIKKSGHWQGWDDETPTFLWSGVVLDFDQRVREINLECFEFMYCSAAEGPLFADFARLERLERLYLSGGRWRGSLPDSWAEPGAFPRLNLLTIASGGLNGTLPAAWGRVGAWPALQKLYLEGNQLQGQLPPEWGTPGAFPKLQLLSLSDNALSSSLPASWGTGAAFPALQTLLMSGTGLVGELPRSWGTDGGLPALADLALARNALQGELPREWATPGRLPKLTKLVLNENKIGGELPREWACEGCLQSLQELSLADNAFSGTLPVAWAGLPSIRTLVLHKNQLTGPLPAAWGAPGVLQKLHMIRVEGNRLNGSLPGSWGQPAALTALSYLDATGNQLSGALPDAWGAANSFPRLRVLVLSQNQLSGPLPSGWHLNSTMQRLFMLDVSKNRITGELPSSWGEVSNAFPLLHVLDVGFNQMGGQLPASWGGSGRSALAALTTLVVAGNNFSGPVPPALGMLPALHYLVLAPGNPSVCRTLPYTGQYVTCFADQGHACQEPVQMRSDCSSNEPGWTPYKAQRGASLTGLQIGLVVAGVSLVAACTTLATVLVLRWREQRRWQALKGLDAELALHSGNDMLADLIAANAARKRGGHSALAEKLLRECAVDKKELSFCRGADGNLVQLGAGAYGQVYKAFMYGVQPVAVKVFQTQDDVPADDFWREVSILRTCNHGNIVQFQGACVDGDTTMMVTELMDTDLYRALQTNRVSWHRHGLDIAIDVAQALHFLHCRNIIHFDCKSPNILLSEDNRAKLGDVGWAQILYHSYITGDGGTFNWAAPEQLIGLKCTAKADVYSYGLVLWELCTRELPVRGQIRDILIPQEAPQMVANLVRECLDVDPARRPSMEAILRRLLDEKARVAREAASNPSSSGPSSTAGDSRSGTASLPSSTGLRGQLAGFPGRKPSVPSVDSEFRAGTSSSEGRASGSGSGSGGGSSAAGARRAGNPAQGSIDASVWGAGSTPQDGSQAGSDSTTSSMLRSLMPIGGPLPRRGPAYSSADPGSGTTSQPSAPPSFVGMPVGGVRSPDGSVWLTASGGAGSGSGHSSQVAGSGGLFEGSAWATGRPAAALGSSAADSGPASQAGGSGSIFEGSAWAAGRPAAALGSSAAGSGPGSQAGGSGSIFEGSAWAAGRPAAALAATGTSYGSAGGSSGFEGASVAGGSGQAWSSGYAGSSSSGAASGDGSSGLTAQAGGVFARSAWAQGLHPGAAAAGAAVAAASPPQEGNPFSNSPWWGAASQAGTATDTTATASASVDGASDLMSLGEPGSQAGSGHPSSGAGGSHHSGVW